MNVLVVSENFDLGGLETHINMYYRTLKDKVNFVFAFANYKDNGYLKDAKIYTGLNLNFNVTTKGFCDSVDKLVEIIKKEKIDIVHAHPFYSIFPSMFAANIANVKLVYTYHGYGSINFVSKVNDILLFMFAVESRINKIFCVSSNVLEFFNNMYNHNAIFLPNLIDEDEFPVHRVGKSKKWALISRIDSDKYPSIIKFLGMLGDLDISEVHIFGTGDEQGTLEEYIKINSLEKKVILKGFIKNVNIHVDGYTGIIGIGRVVQESLCMNYPTIFIGYGKVAGVIDEKIYNQVKNINFVPSTLDDVSVADLKKQIDDINKGKYEKYLLRNFVIDDFGKKNIQKYIDELNSADLNSIDVLNAMFFDFKKCENDDFFYSSQGVFNIIYNRLSFYSKNIYFKSLLIMNLRYFELVNRISTINNSIEKLDSISIENMNEIQKIKAENVRLYQKIKKFMKAVLYRLVNKVRDFRKDK